jgi:hypothetical protein
MRRPAPQHRQHVQDTGEMSDAVTELRVAVGHEAIADDETQRDRRPTPDLLRGPSVGCGSELIPHVGGDVRGVTEYSSRLDRRWE